MSEDNVINADSESEFSGFDPVDDVPPAARIVEVTAEEVVSPRKKKGKSPAKGKKTVKSSKVKPKQAPSSKKKTKQLDISSLSNKDIETLRKKLGLSKEVVFSSEEEYDEVDGPYVDHELPGTSTQYIGNMEKELFGGSDSSEEEDEWRPPRLKSSEKDKPISTSLANLVNVACTSQCELDDIMARHKIPENVDKAGPPLVNNEVWKILDRKVHTQDKYMSDVQNIVATAIVPVIKLASTFGKTLSKEAKTLVSDILTLIGQVQYNLSVRRRYSIRPHLKKKYHSLCNISMPITSQLFGDDISKEIKSCDSLANVGRDSYYKPNWRGRGRGQSQYPYKRGFGGGGQTNYGSSNRFQPYRGSRPYRGRYPRRGCEASPNDK